MYSQDVLTKVWVQVLILVLKMATICLYVYCIRIFRFRNRYGNKFTVFKAAISNYKTRSALEKYHVYRGSYYFLFRLD